MRVSKILIMVLLTCLLSVFLDGQPAHSQAGKDKKRVNKVWLISDSTVADYSLESDYQAVRYPIMGWGQVFQSFMASDSLRMIRHIIRADSVIVEDRARGGRSTRSFFEEGRWSAIYESLNPGDVVMIQFGHNDASVNKGERYTSLTGYKEYLRLYVSQSREKGAIPVLITPVARNYPWKEGRLLNTHGDYPDAMLEVARETGAYCIDLNAMSMGYFSLMGQEYVSKTFFMNFPAGLYPGYPDGSSDNTHFQPAGATAVAQLVFTGMKILKGGVIAGPALDKYVSPATGTAPLPVYSAPAGEIYRDIEFAMPQVIEPQIPFNEVSITDFDAVGDGLTLNTESFRRAIEALSVRGGGTVIIPRGIWLTGPIILKSNIRMHANEGALVVFSPEKNLYPLINTSFEGYNTVRCISPIYGKDLENIAFTGSGVWDGSGEAWRPVKKEKVPPPLWNDFVSSGGVVSDDGKIWYPSESYRIAQEMSDMNVPLQSGGIEGYEGIRDFLRPVMLSLVNCRRILIGGPVF